MDGKKRMVNDKFNKMGVTKVEYRKFVYKFLDLLVFDGYKTRKREFQTTTTNYVTTPGMIYYLYDNAYFIIFEDGEITISHVFVLYVNRRLGMDMFILHNMMINWIKDKYETNN